MDLRAKLARLRNTEPSAGASPQPIAAQPVALTPSAVTPLPIPLAADKAARIAQLRSLIRDVSKRAAPTAAAPAGESGAAPPPWPSVATEHGQLFVHERFLEPHHSHGRAAVAAGVRALPGTLTTLLRDESLAGLDLSRALYLDTETTGLAGGTGTVAFLVGLARFEDDALCLEQLIVPQLGGEAPVLGRLAERIAAASCVITYNGKSFDWPLLRTRFVLSRLPVPELPLHIDLLHVCRSLWKARLPSLRLADMEREILQFEREDDLPGSEIPARYFEFLRTGRWERLTAVLEHNQNDLIALAALLGTIMAQFDHSAELPHPRDALSFGRVALRARDALRAQAFAQRALEDRDAAGDALWLCSEVERQLGRTPEAIACLERALEQTLPSERRAHVHFTLAKMYEHEQGDLERALHHARRTEPVEGPALHGRRLGRLHRRLLRRENTLES